MGQGVEGMNYVVTCVLLVSDNIGCSSSKSLTIVVDPPASLAALAVAMTSALATAYDFKGNPKKNSSPPSVSITF